MGLLETLESLEPVFIQAGQLAYKMQEGVRSYNKRETGNPAGDIVTEADLAAQEFLLKEISKTELVGCRLLAEEDTPSTQLFNPEGEYYLGIDPIDDTAIYAKGGQHFSTIVTLHDGQNLLYSFVYFPAWNWTHKVVYGSYSAAGETPDFALPSRAAQVVVYWSGNPERNIPQEVLASLQDKNIAFELVTKLSTDFGSIGPFAANEVAGVYHENPNVYDGLTELSIASARDQKIYSHLDLDRKSV